VLVVLNMSATPQPISFNLAEQGFPATTATTLLTTLTVPPSGQLNSVNLEPFSVYIAKVTR